MNDCVKIIQLIKDGVSSCNKKLVLKTGHLIHVTISTSFRACLSGLLGVQGGDEKS